MQVGLELELDVDAVKLIDHLDVAIQPVSQESGQDPRLSRTEAK
jgi:hypothetical protein